MSKNLYKEILTGKVCELIDYKVAGMGNKLYGMTLRLYKTSGDDTLKVMCWQEFECKFIKIENKNE